MRLIIWEEIDAEQETKVKNVMKKYRMGACNRDLTYSGVGQTN